MSPAPERATGDALCDILANTKFFPVPVEKVLERQETHRYHQQRRERQRVKVNEQYQFTASVIYEGLPDVLDQNEERRSDLNISDVLEAISLADPTFEPAEGAGGCAAVLEGAMERAPPPHGGPFVRIVEQPASKALRFRYECEGRSAGSIPGVNSTADHKTYPTIEIVGYTGKAIIFVSCVTRDAPHKPHPHNLVGRDRCDKGVCTQKVDVTPENNRFAFSNLGIQCIKRRDIADALKVREDLRVDPFRTGYAHRNQPQSIDLNAVRLCFQVFIMGEGGRMRHSLLPVVSDIIYDKKAMSDLQILRISSSAGPAKGGQELILLCEKVTREDIAVVFYEERRMEGAGGGGATAVVWEEPANIVMVHKQYAIAFTAPAYRDPQPREHIEVFVQLKRPTDNARSVGIPFMYIPDYQEADYIGGKRRKPLRTSLIAQIEQERANWQAQEQKPIKAEPSDKSPLHMGSPHYVPIDRNWLTNPMAGLGEASGVAGAMAASYGGYGEMQWPPTTYQTLSPAMQVPTMSTSPHPPLQGNPAASPVSVMHHSHMQQVMSPQHQQVMSPQHQQVLSPQHQQVLSPQQQQIISPQHQQVLSPQQQQIMSPQHQQVLSPQQQQIMSPQHQQVLSPQHQQVLSPQHQQVLSPQQQQIISPQHQQVLSPQQQQIMSPQHQQVLSPQQQQIMSPQHQQVLSPQHQQVLSPQHQQVLSPQQQQIMSPQHQVMSPQHPQQVMSPHQQVMSPHMSVSPAHMLDQAQQQQHQQQVHQQVQQPMETNSTPSLSRLLEGEGEFNSGDLSTLSAMLGQPYRQDGLTDSLTRLSTSDLMFTPTPRAEL